MTVATLDGRPASVRSIIYYVSVLKPRETGLLTFIAVCSAVVAGGGFPPVRPFVLATVAVLLGSAGCNGVTNYLDMRFDARMRRTCSRVLPSGRISPAWKVLPLAVSLVVASLVLAWTLGPLLSAVGIVGALASVAWRKTITCTYFGVVASCCPVIIGWLAIRPSFSTDIVLLCLLIAFWIPLHVWTVMIANRQDYAAAGLRYFPLTWPDGRVIKTLVAMSLGLVVVSIFLFVLGSFGLLYLGIAIVMGSLMVAASVRLVVAPSSSSAWRVYKLSAFPYLGLVFAAMALDSRLF